MKCRITGENCKIFLNFGKMPLANGFLTEEECRVKVSASTTTATGTTPSIPGVSTGSSSVSSLGGT